MPKTKKTSKPGKNKKKKSPEALELERVKRKVKHNFLDDELITFGYTLGQKYRAIRSVQAEAKAIKAQFKAREDTLNADIDEVSSKINAGFEMRDKDCFKLFDYKGGVVYWFLCDDVDAIALDPKTFPDADEFLFHLLKDDAIDPAYQRPIRDHERQQKLDGGVNESGDGEDKQAPPEVVTS